MENESRGPVPPPRKPRRARARPVSSVSVAPAVGGPRGGLRDAALAARAQGDVAILALASIAQDENAPATARVAAAVRLLERGFGRAASEPGAAEPSDLFGLSDAEFESLLAEAGMGAETGMEAGDAGPG